MGRTIRLERPRASGVLAKSFNAMSAGLKKAQTEMLATAALSRSSISPGDPAGPAPKKIPRCRLRNRRLHAPAKEVGGDLYDSSASTTSAWPWWWRRLGKSVPGSLA